VGGSGSVRTSPGQGGGFYHQSGALTVSNSTITGNVAREDRGLLGVTGQGGGIYKAGGTVNLRNTILAGNTNASSGAGAVGADLWGRLASSGYNLIGDATGGSGYAPTDLLDADPLLGPLQDNGGPTLTHALLPGSPALDAGDPDQLGTTDQRGV